MYGASGRLVLAMAALAGSWLLPPRIGADPAPDPAFGVNGIARTAFGTGNNDEPFDLLVQPDGRILTAGISRNSATQEWFIALSRHTTVGVPDSAGFGVDGTVLTHFVFRDQANAIALQDDGKIVAAGMRAISNAASQQVPSTYRFHPHGAVDTTFAGTGSAFGRYDPISSGEHSSVTIRPDGKIVAAGRCNANINGGVNGFGMKRYLPDGTQDLSSRRDFNVAFDRGSCAFTPDGRVLWVLNAVVSGQLQYVMARADSAGNADTTFGGDGIVQTGIASIQNVNPRVLVLDDGKILLAGTTPKGGGHSQWSVFRFHPDGVPDSLFGTDGRTDVVFTASSDHCRDMAVDPYGRILLVGGVSLGFGQAGLARLNPDGGMDPSFSDDGKMISNLNNNSGTHYLSRVRILGDGSILAAGWDFASNGGDFLLVKYGPETTTGVEEAAVAPERIPPRVFPNPSRTATTIRFGLRSKSLVRVSIFDAGGRAVRRVFDGELEAGMHSLPWDGRDEAGRDAPAGVFFAKISTSEGTETGKLVRLR